MSQFWARIYKIMQEGGFEPPNPLRDKTLNLACLTASLLLPMQTNKFQSYKTLYFLNLKSDNHYIMVAFKYPLIFKKL